ncbi:LOW QUALITY PROTEIN: uncharacterized protein [Gorilla gorilla gorilla]|uniref:LOW QUALITY PROTEIN: uncharacterized protein n=1 Tax=Gorilla gorilla gorilla TaxID=9595 RepID=UPI003BA372AF
MRNFKIGLRHCSGCVFYKQNSPFPQVTYSSEFLGFLLAAGSPERLANVPSPTLTAGRVHAVAVNCEKECCFLQSPELIPGCLPYMPDNIMYHKSTCLLKISAALGVQPQTAGLLSRSLLSPKSHPAERESAVERKLDCAARKGASRVPSGRGRPQSRHRVCLFQAGLSFSPSYVPFAKEAGSGPPCGRRRDSGGPSPSTRATASQEPGGRRLSSPQVRQDTRGHPSTPTLPCRLAAWL